MFTISNILMHLCTRDLCVCKVFPTSFSYTRLFHIAFFNKSGIETLLFYNDYENSTDFVNNNGCPLKQLQSVVLSKSVSEICAKYALMVPI